MSIDVTLDGVPAPPLTVTKVAYARRFADGYPRPGYLEVSAGGHVVTIVVQPHSSQTGLANTVLDKIADALILEEGA
jgi:hypothetical protein